MIIAMPLALLTNGSDGGFFERIGFELISFVLALWLMSRAFSPKIWSFHGAEHKAVNAYEQGANLEELSEVMNCSRVHDRCGSNLAVIIILISLIAIPSGGSSAALLASSAYTLLAIGLAVELFRYLTKFPTLFLTRIFLFGGRQLQKYVTTREPTTGQLEVAVKAVKTVLALEAQRLIA